jgi:hypothetical protein
LRAVLCPKRGSLLEGHLGAGGFAVLRQEAPCVGGPCWSLRGMSFSVRALLVIRGERVAQ